jgi:hypothetical protein
MRRKYEFIDAPGRAGDAVAFLLLGLVFQALPTICSTGGEGED